MKIKSPTQKIAGNLVAKFIFKFIAKYGSIFYKYSAKFHYFSNF